jgi:competence/damage-inducible protein cinA C-terminal domain
VIFLLQFAIFKGVEMKNLILIIGDEIRVNRPFLNYIFEIYENKFGVLDDVIFIRNKDTNLAEILEHFIANRRNLTIFCAPSSFAVVSQILASLCDDSIELTNGLLSPTTAICAQKGTILMKIKECIINLIQADPLTQIPPILMNKEGERKNFYIVDFEPDLIRSAMEKICIKFGIFIQISRVCKYVVQVRAKTGEFGNLNGFLKEVAIKFDNLVIFDANLAQFLVNKLRQLDMRVTFAESCTGGLAAARLCEISGASDVFSGSFITYANELKTQILGVREEILREFGAVSRECVSQMLSGAIRASGSDFAVAFSGIAGPGGGSDEKPVGTVYIGAMDSAGNCIIERFLLSGDRNYIRETSVNIGYALLLKLRVDLFF